MLLRADKRVGGVRLWQSPLMPSGPPPLLRATATRADAADLERVCGVAFRLEDLPALLDPRGLRFQRLEWLGDAVLDGLLAQHRRPGPACCAAVPLEQLSSDVALTVRAQQAGLAGCLDWQPSPGRLADLVEALVGAAWQVEPPAAVEVAGRLVHPGLALAPVAATGPDGGCAGLKPDAQLGSAVLEAAGATLLVDEQPQADEGQLSAAQQRQLGGTNLVRRGRRQDLVGSCDGDPEHLLDHVQAAIGRTSAAGGLLAGLDQARTLLRS